MNRLSLIPLVLALSLAGHAGAQSVPPQQQLVPIADTAQLEAVAQMLATMKMPTLLRHQMTHTPTLTQEQRELFQHISTHVSDQDICQMLAPVYAAYIRATDARQVTVFNRSPQGQRRVDDMLIQAGAQGGDKHLLYTDQELAEYRRINALPGMRAIGANQKEVAARVTVALRSWSTRYYMAYRNKAMMRVAALARAASEPGAAQQMPEPLLEPTGMATLDKVMDVIARNSVQIARMTAAMQQDIGSYNIGKIIDPVQLTSAKGIAQSRANLARADQRMERYLSDVMAQLQRYRERMAEFVPDAKSRENMEAEIAPAYTLMLRLAEVQRAMFDVFGRVLDFTESRLGRIESKDGRLVFQDEADRPPLQELMVQLQKIGADARQVASDGDKMSTGALDAFKEK
jgi:hypothetical protein